MNDLALKLWFPPGVKKVRFLASAMVSVARTNFASMQIGLLRQGWVCHEPILPLYHCDKALTINYV